MLFYIKVKCQTAYLTKEASRPGFPKLFSKGPLNRKLKSYGLLKKLPLKTTKTFFCSSSSSPEYLV